MITLTYRFAGAELPLTISKEHLVKYLMEYKGKGIELFEAWITEVKKENDELAEVLIKNMLEKLNKK